MTKVCLLRNMLTLFCLTKRRVFNSSVVLFAAMLALNAKANQTETSCQENGFSNQVYVVEVADVANVTQFFRDLPGNYFELKDFFIDKAGKQVIEQVFFDDHSLSLLKNDQQLYISVSKNLPIYRRWREKLVYQNFRLKQRKNYEVKRYNKKTSVTDKHPLFGSVKRKERSILKSVIEAQNPNIKVLELSPKLTVNHNETVYMITHFGKPYGTIILDDYHIDNFGLANTSLVIKYNLFSIDQLNSTEKDTINTMFCRMTSDFSRLFPSLYKMKNVSYTDFYRQAIKVLPTRIVFIENRNLYALGQILVLTFIGFLVLHLIIGRYQKKQLSRVIFRGARRVYPKGKESND